MWTRFTRKGRRSRRAFVAAVAMLTFVQAAPGRAGDTSEGDRKALLAQLERTEKLFLASIEGLNEAQWKWKPAPDRWSVAEVSEHITLAEAMLRGVVTDQVMKAPASPELLAKTKGKESMILKGVPDRTNRAQAPEVLVPKGKWATAAATIAAFKEERAKTVALAKDTSKDLRAFATVSQIFQEMDAYQWVLFLSSHTERHTKQIEEVKGTAGFPK